VEARTQNSKVFVKENRNFAAIITNDSLHYQDQQGKWQDIDSRLKTSNQSGFAYESTANRFQSFFADNGLNELMRFQFGDKWIELNPQSRNETKPQVTGIRLPILAFINGIDLQYIKLCG